jgi:hypothetical protein
MVQTRGFHTARSLTEQQVREIRALHGTWTQQQIAKHYGISTALVSFIWNRKVWTHLE